jgi:hypothetical protein
MQINLTEVLRSFMTVKRISAYRLGLSEPIGLFCRSIFIINQIPEASDVNPY